MNKKKTQASGNERREKNFYFSLDSIKKHDRIDFISLLEREAMIDRESVYYSKSGIFDDCGNDIDEEVMQSDNGRLKLKDNASRLLLSVAFKHELEGKSSQAEKVFLNVSENASETFIDNFERESAQAKEIAVDSLLNRC